MSSKTTRVDDSSDSSSSDDCNLYSGQAKRFKLTKQALFPTGMVKLVDNPKSSQSQQSQSTGPNYDSDSSSENIFQNIKNKQAGDGNEQDLDESQVSISKQVETLEDLEDYIDLSPDISQSEGENTNSPKRKSPIQAYLVEDSSDIDDVLPASPVANEIEDSGSIDMSEKVTIKVRFCSNITRIELTRGQYFKEIIQQLALKANVEPTNIALYLNDKLLDPYDSLKTIPIGIADIIDGSITKEVAVSNAVMLEFKVQTQNRSCVAHISIRSEDPMSVLMEKYAAKTKNDLNRLTFRFDGDLLQPDDTPTSLDLEGGECIDVYIKQ